MGRLDRDTKQHVARRAARRHTALEAAAGEFMYTQLWNMQEELQDVEETLHDTDTLLDILDGADDQVVEFQLLFADLQNDVEHMTDLIGGWGFDQEQYDLCMVSLIGAKQRLIDYDQLENDYSFIDHYGAEIEQKRAREALMRMTKADMIDAVGKSLSIFLAFFDVLKRYEALSDTLEILKGETAALGAAIREINKLYDEIAVQFPQPDTVRHFDRLAEQLPDRVWIE